MYKIEHFDLLYKCVSDDMITDIRFLDVWVEIGYVLDKMGLEKYLDEVKELAIRMSVFHILVQAFTSDRNRKYEKAYKAYKDDCGVVTDTDEKEYSRNIKKCAENMKRRNEIFRADEDAEKSVPLIKHNDGKNMYFLPNSKIQNDVMIKSDKPWARNVRNLLNKMSSGAFAKTKNYTNKRVENDLKAVCEAYREIKRYDITYFEKCFEFYSLEYSTLIETLYKFLKTAGKVGRKGKTLVQDMRCFGEFCIRPRIKALDSGMVEIVLANVFALDMKLFYELYSKSPNNLSWICNMHRDLEGRVISNEMEKYQIVNIEKVIESEFAQDYFKDYCGEGQYIEFNKNFGPTGVPINKFRSFFSPDFLNLYKQI